MTATEMTAEAAITEAAETAVEEGAPEVSETAAVAEAASKDPRYIAVNMTPELLSAIRTECTEQNTNPGALLRSIVCAHFGIETTVSGPRKKYASDEERKAAKKAYTADRNATIKMLLAKHRAELSASATTTTADDAE